MREVTHVPIRSRFREERKRRKERWDRATYGACCLFVVVCLVALAME